MYEAINTRLIAKSNKAEKKTDSGIIIGDEKDSNDYLIVATTEETKSLQDRTVVAYEMTPLDGGFVAIELEKVIAILND